MQNKISFNLIAFFTLFSLPFLSFFITFQRFALNVPFEDDFGILRNIYDIGVNDDLSVKFKNIISTSNEHSIIVSKLFFGLNIWLFKSIHFTTLMFIGNAIFFSSFVVFFKLCSLHKISIWVLLPLPYTLLSGSTFESGLWAICSFQYNAICGFFIWSIYLIFSDKITPKKFYLGLFLLVCTLICNGNGILAFLLVGAGLIYQKRWKELSITTVLFFALKIFFLTNSYYKVPNSPLITLLSFCVLVGGSFKTDSLNHFVQLIGGSITVFISLVALNYIIKRRQSTFEFIILLLALFSFGSLLGIALFREIGSSLFADRYRLYSQFLLICVYLLLIIYLPSKAKQLSFWASTFGVFYFLHMFYVTYPAILNIYQKKKLLSLNWNSNGSALNGSFYRLYFDETLYFYQRDTRYLLEKPLFDIKKAKKSNEIIDILIENTKNGNLIKVKNIDCSRVSEDKGYYIVLENSKHQIYFLPVLHLRNSINGVFNGQALLKNEFIAPIVYAEIPAETYSVGLISNIDSYPIYFKTNKSIIAHKVGYEQ